MTVPLRKRVKRRVRSVLLVAAVRLLAFVPLRLALALGTAVGSVGWVLARRTRRQILAQLAIAFPERSDAEREAIGRASLLHLAWLAAEVMTLPHWRARLPDYVGLAPGVEEVFRGALARGRGVVYVAGHVGNWELMAQRVPRLGPFPAATIAKATIHAELNVLIERTRGDGGVETLWREDRATARAMLRCFKENKILGILIDQDTSVQGVFVPFFGRPAFTPRAAADLALRFRAPVVVGTCRRRGPRPGDGHEVAAVEIPHDPDAPDREAEVIRLTAACSAVLEEAIRRNPAEWVWMHERWKSTPPEVSSGAAPQAKPVPKTAELSGG
ncbi:MAG TPA: lipid A biosynthesis acyltransferase [Anaeromyxobacter sp.]